MVLPPACLRQQYAPRLDHGGKDGGEREERAGGQPANGQRRGAQPAKQHIVGQAHQHLGELRQSHRSGNGEKGAEFGPERFDWWRHETLLLPMARHGAMTRHPVPAGRGCVACRGLYYFIARGQTGRGHFMAGALDHGGAPA